MNRETKIASLIEMYGAKIAQQIASEMVYELSDLPKIPYNERRLSFWKDILSFFEEHSK